MDELIGVFSVDGISKSPAIFDYDKLEWMNGEYIKNMTLDEYAAVAEPYLKQGIKNESIDLKKVAAILQQRVTRLTQIPDMISFFDVQPEYEKELFVNKKSKTNLENSPVVLQMVIDKLKTLESWDHDSIHDCLINLAQEQGLKNGTVMWPARIAVSGKTVTPGGAIEILDILGREEAIGRMEKGLAKLKA